MFPLLITVTLLMKRVITSRPHSSSRVYSVLVSPDSLTSVNVTVTLSKFCFNSHFPDSFKKETTKHSELGIKGTGIILNRLGWGFSFLQTSNEVKFLSLGLVTVLIR